MFALQGYLAGVLMGIQLAEMAPESMWWPYLMTPANELRSKLTSAERFSGVATMRALAATPDWKLYLLITVYSLLVLRTAGQWTRERRAATATAALAALAAAGVHFMALMPAQLRLAASSEKVAGVPELALCVAIATWHLVQSVLLTTTAFLTMQDEMQIITKSTMPPSASAGAGSGIKPLTEADLPTINGQRPVRAKELFANTRDAPAGAGPMNPPRLRKPTKS
ncbi:hypothetical protein CXG81DRAFT_23614 [Caulochytrium protostelioides]|uniref:Uncharacterized protein n=1 Tax=Caulochytrium protostelioides TaxID=1555241 RepID=A0A4V1IVE5_9FUNG|nr:hypothetical protein CXG81DRAFT_23614 [Caulochytrium protostelioides]|eukprot:RKP03779.1 hypothetical protein CXG81DRAFT_23614 [Caulochytrium protostelioides]